MPKTTRSKWKRWLIWLIFQAVASLLLLEGALAFLAPRHAGIGALLYTPAAQTQYDRMGTLEELLSSTTLGFIPFREQQGFILNSRSFRTPEYTGDKPPGSFRVMVLGDSFTFASGGVPYSRMWTTEARRQLQRHSQAPIDVFALGVPGVGPRFELRLFELERSIVRPDVVLMAFYVGNDFTDEQKVDSADWVESVAVQRSRVVRLGRNLSRLLSERQMAERWMKSSWSRKVYIRGGVEVPGDAVGPQSRDPNRYVAWQANRLRLCLTQESDRFDQLAAAAGPVLERFAATVRASGAEPVVVILPEEYQVDAEARQRVLNHLEITEDALDLQRPQRWLSEYLAARGIRHLDLLPSFLEQRESQLYWPYDSHWNLAGNELAGRAVARYLLDEGLVPAASLVPE